jgi:hypothetical protein
MRTLLATFILSLLLVGSSTAATITIVNLDGVNEGFNDPTPAAPVGGNPGTTIGQQRLNLFNHAADIWGSLLPSNIEIRVEARFNPLSCDASSGVLGSASPITVVRDFPGAEFAGTWYHVALANRLAGVDLAPTANDITTTFNSSIDNNNNCLAGTNWYYGFDGNEGNDVELLPVLLHEMGHGLGFSNFVTLSTGGQLQGFTDIYSRFLLDNSNGLHWNQMSNGQRAASAVNTGNVVWDGTAVTTCAPDVLGDNPTLFINSPNTLPSTMAIGTASFGPALTTLGVTGNVVLADDGSGTVSDACEPLVNGGAISGNIALIDRGTCAFVDKAQNAQNAGAIAVIIANNQPTGANGLGGSSGSITIPVVSVSQADGNALKAELGGGVNVTIGLDSLMLAGADSNDRVKVYAPNPLELGSSISHWDTSANPSLLMEPAITGGLSSGVDLTIKHFEDIGWLTSLATDVPDARVHRNALYPNQPNPFNPQTTIQFSLMRGGATSLEVFDVAGRRVTTLLREHLAAGPHRVDWNGTDATGRTMASGVYLVRLQSGDFEQTRRMLLLK